MDGEGWAKEQMVGEGEGGGTEVGMLNKRKLKEKEKCLVILGLGFSRLYLEN